ncbi:MAG TPA: ATP-dependent zinc metalloprotease FtsH [Spirochaetia bacterium]|nr:ATP-dependent zinc metalloprotease FtsH [Spirochaetia bacterium]
MSNNNDNRDDKGPDPRVPRFNFNNRIALISLLILVSFFVFFFVYNDRTMSQELSYSTFQSYLDEGRVDTVKIIDQYEIQGSLKTSSGEVSLFKTTIPYPDPDLMKTLKDKGVKLSGGAKAVSPLAVLIQFLPWVIGFFFIWFMFRQVQGNGNRAFSFGKSRAKRYLDSGKRITFTDVAGQEEAKYELQEVVEFLKSPQKFARLGAKIPKGVLLVGMPGTGKTLLAKAIAGEANVAFFHMSGSDFVEMFVGVGASRVRDLFEQGRRHAPCILFIDELDAVGRTRGAGYGGGHDEREQTLNQMLVEMDGFDTKDGVIILAATNRPDVLDPALLRPGRFDRQVVVDMPDIKERELILKLHARRLPLSENVDLSRLARATPGSSGADLANLVNEAALFAGRKGKDRVEMDDFEEARDKTLMGVARKSKVIPPKEKLMVACHEAGHGLLHYYLKNADPLHKITIIPHGRALGVAFSLPEDDAYSRNKGWLHDRITIAMGGYAAERIIYEETTTGAANDLEQATEIARKMVCEWGMSELLGPVAYGQKEEPIFLGKEIARHKDYSEETARAIDTEIKKIVEASLSQALSLLTEHKDQLKRLSDTLIIRENLDDDEIRVLLGFPPRKREPDPAVNGVVAAGNGH